MNNNRRNYGNNPISFEIIESIGVLSKSDGGWIRELNIVSWNSMEPKFDIRDWNEEHNKMSKGITLRKEEMENLVKLYKEYDL